MSIFIRELRREAPWIALLLIAVYLLPLTWWSITMEALLFLGIPQLLLWLVLMKKFVKHYGGCEYFSGKTAAPGFAIIGDSIAAGYGTPDQDQDCRIHQWLRYYTDAAVKMESSPFLGTKKLPELLGKLGKTEKRYKAIIMSVGGNDVIPFASGSLQEIRDALSTTIAEAIKMTEEVILLENFSGLGEVYPVWWLRIYFRSRGEKVHRIYDDVLFSYPKVVVRLNISPILTNRKNLARDGVHPGKQAYLEINRLLIPAILYRQEIS